MKGGAFSTETEMYKIKFVRTQDGTPTAISGSGERHKRFVQDIIVLPDYQRKRIGTKLLKAVMERYKDVYQMELLTDNTEKTKAFYRSVGFSASDDMGCVVETAKGLQGRNWRRRAG